MTKGDGGQASTRKSGNKRRLADRRGGGPVAVARFVESLTRRALGGRGFAEASIITEWETIVGAERAADCRPDRLTFPQGRRSGGTLHLRVTSTSAPEIQHDAPRLIERINRYFGYAAVARLKLMNAPLLGARAAPEKDRPKTSPPPPDPARLAALRQALATVEDVELRETLERLGAAVMGGRGERES